MITGDKVVELHIGEDLDLERISTSSALHPLSTLSRIRPGVARPIRPSRSGPAATMVPTEPALRAKLRDRGANDKLKVHDGGWRRSARWGGDLQDTFMRRGPGRRLPG